MIAYVISSTGGKEPSLEAKEIIHRFVCSELDYETEKKILIEKIVSRDAN